MSPALTVCYTGDRPPDWFCDQAAAIGVDLVPLSEDGAPLDQPAQVADRLAALRPAGYLMNHPHYGPRLSVELADAAGGSLRIVTYMGATRETDVYQQFFDIPGLRERGVVLTAPTGVSLLVAEATITLVLALELGLIRAHTAAMAGPVAWSHGIALGSRHGLFGSALGIVGLGQIGQRVAQLATALGMHVLYASRTRRPDLEDTLNLQHATLPELIERVDHLTIHTPIRTTRGLIGRDLLSRASGITLVNNTVDPRIVDPDALIEALETDRVRRAAIEGHYPEPHQQALRDLGDDRVLLLPQYASWGDSPHEHERAWQQQLETYRAFVEGRRTRDELR